MEKPRKVYSEIATNFYESLIERIDHLESELKKKDKYISQLAADNYNNSCNLEIASQRIAHLESTLYSEKQLEEVKKECVSALMVARDKTVSDFAYQELDAAIVEIVESKPKTYKEEQEQNPNKQNNEN